MKLYRICTENKNYNDILDYLDQHFPDGYTIINANGAWQGVREKSLVIEITWGISEYSAGKSIDKLAYWLRKHNNQQIIMIQTIDIDVQML